MLLGTLDRIAPPSRFCAMENDVHPIRAVIATVANSLFLIMFLFGLSLSQPTNICR